MPHVPPVGSGGPQGKTVRVLKCIRRREAALELVTDITERWEGGEFGGVSVKEIQEEILSAVTSLRIASRDVVASIREWETVETTPVGDGSFVWQGICYEQKMHTDTRFLQSVQYTNLVKLLPDGLPRPPPVTRPHCRGKKQAWGPLPTEKPLPPKPEPEDRPHDMPNLKTTEQQQHESRVVSAASEAQIARLQLQHLLSNTDIPPRPPSNSVSNSPSNVSRPRVSKRRAFFTSASISEQGSNYYWMLVQKVSPATYGVKGATGREFSPTTNDPVHAFSSEKKLAAVFLHHMHRVTERDEAIPGIPLLRLLVPLQRMDPMKKISIHASTVDMSSKMDAPGGKQLYGCGSFGITMGKLQDFERSGRLAVPHFIPVVFFKNLSVLTTDDGNAMFFTLLKDVPLCRLGNPTEWDSVLSSQVHLINNEKRELGRLRKERSSIVDQGAGEHMHTIWSVEDDVISEKQDLIGTIQTQIDFLKNRSMAGQLCMIAEEVGQFLRLIRTASLQFGFDTPEDAARSLRFSLNEISSKICKSQHGTLLCDGTGGRSNQLNQPPSKSVVFLHAFYLPKGDFNETQDTHYALVQSCVLQGVSHLCISPSQYSVEWLDSLVTVIGQLYVNKGDVPFTLWLGTQEKAFNTFLNREDLDVVVHNASSKFLACELAREGFNVGLLVPSSCLSIALGKVGGYWETGTLSTYGAEEDLAATSTSLLAHSNISMLHDDSYRYINIPRHTQSQRHTSVEAGFGVTASTDISEAEPSMGHCSVLSSSLNPNTRTKHHETEPTEPEYRSEAARLAARAREHLKMLLDEELSYTTIKIKNCQKEEDKEREKVARLESTGRVGHVHCRRTHSMKGPCVNMSGDGQPDAVKGAVYLEKNARNSVEIEERAERARHFRIKKRSVSRVMSLQYERMCVEFAETIEPRARYVVASEETADRTLLFTLKSGYLQTSNELTERIDIEFAEATNRHAQRLVEMTDLRQTIASLQSVVTPSAVYVREWSILMDAEISERMKIEGHEAIEYTSLGMEQIIELRSAMSKGTSRVIVHESEQDANAYPMRSNSDAHSMQVSDLGSVRKSNVSANPYTETILDASRRATLDSCDVREQESQPSDAGHEPQEREIVSRKSSKHSVHSVKEDGADELEPGREEMVPPSESTMNLSCDTTEFSASSAKDAHDEQGKSVSRKSSMRSDATSSSKMAFARSSELERSSNSLDAAPPQDRDEAGPPNADKELALQKEEAETVSRKSSVNDKVQSRKSSVRSLEEAKRSNNSLLDRDEVSALREEVEAALQQKETVSRKSSARSERTEEEAMSKKSSEESRAVSREPSKHSIKEEDSEKAPSRRNSTISEKAEGPPSDPPFKKDDEIYQKSSVEVYASLPTDTSILGPVETATKAMGKIPSLNTEAMQNLEKDYLNGTNELVLDETAMRCHMKLHEMTVLRNAVAAEHSRVRVPNDALACLLSVSPNTDTRQYGISALLQLSDDSISAAEEEVPSPPAEEESMNRRNLQHEESMIRSSHRICEMAQLRRSVAAQHSNLDPTTVTREWCALIDAEITNRMKLEAHESIEYSTLGMTHSADLRSSISKETGGRSMRKTRRILKNEALESITDRLLLRLLEKEDDKRSSIANDEEQELVILSSLLAAIHLSLKQAEKSPTPSKGDLSPEQEKTPLVKSSVGSQQASPKQEEAAAALPDEKVISRKSSVAKEASLSRKGSERSQENAQSKPASRKSSRQSMHSSEAEKVPSRRGSVCSIAEHQNESPGPAHSVGSDRDTVQEGAPLSRTNSKHSSHSVKKIPSRKSSIHSAPQEDIVSRKSSKHSVQEEETSKVPAAVSKEDVISEIASSKKTWAHVNGEDMLIASEEDLVSKGSYVSQKELEEMVTGTVGNIVPKEENESVSEVAVQVLQRAWRSHLSRAVLEARNYEQHVADELMIRDELDMHAFYEDALQKIARVILRCISRKRVAARRYERNLRCELEETLEEEFFSREADEAHEQ